MTQAAEEMKRSLAALDMSDRAEPAAFLLGSLDEAEDGGVDAGWEAEITRREQEFTTGVVQSTPADDVLADARARLADRGCCFP